MNDKLLRAILWNIHDDLAANEGASITLPKAYRNHLYKMHYEYFPAMPYEKHDGHFGKKPMYIYFDDVESMQVRKITLGVGDNEQEKEA